MFTDDAGNGGGYGKPPEHSRFKKGQSGNPRGRPKGSKNLSTLVFEELRKKVTLPIEGKVRRVSKGELAAKMWVSQVIKGDHKAREQILKLEEHSSTIYGKQDSVPEEIFVSMVFDNEEMCGRCGYTCGPGMMSHHQCPHGPVNI